MTQTRTKVYTFTVTGRGPFPIDMLRVDYCWPWKDDDSATIVRSILALSDARLRDSYTLRLGGLGAPHLSEWAARGWTVENGLH